jgi:isopenicillin-N epimerase
MKDIFLLDPDITYLNFGSFGACPKPVFNEYQRIQLELEQKPVQFMINSGLRELNVARKRLSKYLACNANDLVYMTNPSYGINTIAKSIPLSEGDEILTTNLEYGAMDRTWNYYCHKVGAKYVQQEIGFPIQSKAHFLDQFWKGYTSKTKIVFISHITSSTGLILPVKEIIHEAKSKGLLTIIDGAHVPGQLTLNLTELGADIYVGACHKWMMGPKGSSFLYVNKKEQHWVDPLLISWGFQSDTPSDSTFIDYHQTAGTRDFSAFLTIPFCLDFMTRYKWEEVRANCQKKTIEWASKFQKEFDFKSICPINDKFIGQMYSIPISTADPLLVKDRLYNEYQIEIPVFLNQNDVFIRFSYQAFNSDQDMEALFIALAELKNDGTIDFVTN